MGNRLYIGNLAFQTTENDLRDAFASHGNVVEVKLVSDRETGRSRGFGFVSMGSDDEAQKAMQALNGSVLDGRELRVNEAEERSQRGGGGRGRSDNRW